MTEKEHPTVAEYQAQFQYAFPHNYTDEELADYNTPWFRERKINLAVAKARGYVPWERDGDKRDFFALFADLPTHAARPARPATATKPARPARLAGPQGTHEEHVAEQSDGLAILRYPHPSLIGKYGPIFPELKTKLAVLTEAAEVLHADLTTTTLPLFLAYYRSADKDEKGGYTVPVKLDVTRRSQYVNVWNPVEEKPFPVPVLVFISKDAGECEDVAKCRAARRRGGDKNDQCVECKNKAYAKKRDEHQAKNKDHRFWDSDWAQGSYGEADAFEPGSWKIHHHAQRMWHGDGDAPCPKSSTLHNGRAFVEQEAVTCAKHQTWEKANECEDCVAPIFHDEKACEGCQQLRGAVILKCRKDKHKREACPRCIHIKHSHAGQNTEQIHGEVDTAKYTFASSGSEDFVWVHDHAKEYDWGYYQPGGPDTKFRTQFLANRSRTAHLKSLHYNKDAGMVVEPIGKHTHHEKIKPRDLKLAARVDCHPWSCPLLERATTIFIGIEGCPKADSMLSQGLAVVSVPAVGQWDIEEMRDFIQWLKDRPGVDWNDVTIVIVADADWWLKREVVGQARLFQLLLQDLGVQKVMIAAPPVDPESKLPVFMKHGKECPADPETDRLYKIDKTVERCCSCGGCIEAKGVDDWFGGGGTVEGLHVVERLVDFKSLEEHIHAEAERQNRMDTVKDDIKIAAALIQIAASENESDPDQHGAVPATFRTLGRALRSVIGEDVAEKSLATLVRRHLLRLAKTHGIIDYPDFEQAHGGLSQSFNPSRRGLVLDWTERPCLRVRPEWRADDLEPEFLADVLGSDLRSPDAERLRRA